ncbi:hypothetical protein L2W58_00170 [Dethiosulfovibrio sp. F2B]|uniref:hypothetical protein n=1 Tax=Dethiosulfovibrio faecalis TaxID=2720018 RepID=UPI001F16A408|nr:hypothetical protein [Dethiosulfovibrio faecalis]MCF4150223.1 hypothetical protein [Dethiosulfovibrio faecalis]
MANVRNSNDIVLGSGRMFLDGEDVGQLKDDLTFEHGKEMYELKAGFPATVVLSALVSEELTLSFNLLETNLDMVCRLMPEYDPVTENAGTATVADELVTLFDSVHTMLGKGRVEGDATVTTVDGTALTEGVDYYLDRLNGTIYRVPDSAKIADGDDVKACYTYKTYESKGFGVGGGTSTDKTFRVDFYHKRRDGKYRHVRIWKGKVKGNFSMAFKEASESPLAVEVTAIADSTKPAGRQLMTVMDVPAEAVPGGGW